MIKFKMIGNSQYPDIQISDGINSFMIARNNLPDLCWYPEIDYYRNSEDVIFTIKEEDELAYSLFLKLYDDINEGRIFGEDNSKYEGQTPKIGLVKGDEVIIHSEDYEDYDHSSVLVIRKSIDKIDIIFKKSKIILSDSNIHIPTYNIRITESFGRYWPFNVIFTNFHRQLQEIAKEAEITSIGNQYIKSEN